jgi:hypothetical protein
MVASISADYSLMSALAFLVASFLWTVFLIFDVRRRPNPPSTLCQIGLLCHNIPALSLLVTNLTAQSIQDNTLVWFIYLLTFRYWRTIINIWFWLQYELATPASNLKVTPKHCTVIIPTVGPAGNKVFEDMVAAILVNQAARLIFSTNTASAAQQVKDALPAILANVEAGSTSFQKQHGLGLMKVITEILPPLNANISNKRQQTVHAFSEVETDILVMVDDTAIWNPRFLQATLPAFQSDKVGRYSQDPTADFFTNLWKQYVGNFWICMGGLYLVRHNFEIRATNAADGGVFCVSGRTSLIRTSIVKNTLFTEAFLNEYVLRFGELFPGWGPVTADDDNFITRWVINHGWDVKIQSCKEATMTTVLGTYPLKFPDQAKRWSRTTFRQNPIALFVDRCVWWKWPLTVWTTLFPWMYNAALFWDVLAVYTLTQTDLYAQSTHRATILSSLIAFIWISKLVKTIPWFWEYPTDFFLYFVIPAYPLFAYWHSLLKVHTAFTFWDLAWSGRKLKQ